MTIIVCPRSAVPRLVRQRRPAQVVSLLGPDDKLPRLTLPPEQRLHLMFNDIAEARRGLIAPDPSHIRALLDFLQAWDRAAPLLIHCWAGISRSTAAGYIAASVREGPGSEADLARRLRAAAPTATPNPLVVALADVALQRDGAMVAAIAAIGRGAEADEGRPFDL